MKMTIAHVICTFPPYKGGMGNSVYYSALEIGKLGHDVTVFTPNYVKGIPREEQLSPNVRVIRLRPLFSIGNAAVMPQLAWKLWKYDIIHLHYPFYGTADFIALIAVWRRVLGKRSRLIMSYHMDTLGSGFKRFMFSIYKFFLLPIIARAADMIACSSLDYIKHSDLAAYFEHHQSKFIQVPFGVDADLFTPLTPAAREPVILFVGGLNAEHYFKGVPQLIEAFARVHRRFPEARLWLVGSGNLEEEYRQLAVSRGIGNAMQIKNKENDAAIRHDYCEASVLVLPSINKSEAFGLVLLEAMACGTPVIASNLPGVRSVFRNKDHGLLVQPGNVDDLAQKLETLLRHPEEARAMGERARRWVEDNYSWKRVAQELETVYCRLAYSPTKEDVQPDYENLPD